MRAREYIVFSLKKVTWQDLFILSGNRMGERHLMNHVPLTHLELHEKAVQYKFE